MDDNRVYFRTSFVSACVTCKHRAAMSENPPNPKGDAFLEEIQRLKREAAGDLEWHELAERLREIERRNADRLVRPSKSGADGA